MKSFVALAVLVICVASCYGIQWKDCGSKLSTVKNVMVSGCESTPVCDLPRGTDVNFTVDFTTKAVANNLTSVVHGIIDKVPIPFPFSHPKACEDKHCGLICPLKASKPYSYHPIINVKKAFPKLKVIVKWELQDATGADVFCIEVAAEIVDPKNTKDQNDSKPHFSHKMPKRGNSLPFSKKIPKNKPYLHFNDKRDRYLPFSKEMFKRKQ